MSESPVPTPAEIWLIGFDGADLTMAYPTEEAAKSAVMARFADHWTAEGVTETQWTTYSRNQKRRRQTLCGNAHGSREPNSNIGWFVQPVPVAPLGEVS